MGRDRYTGPDLATGDLSGFKDTHISGKTTLQLRVEVFNLPNRDYFNRPNLITSVLQAPPNATSQSGRRRQVR